MSIKWSNFDKLQRLQSKCVVTCSLKFGYYTNVYKEDSFAIKGK